MKKKTKRKPAKKSKPKIDVVLESLLNLETVVRQLINKVEQLQYSQKYWPNTDPPFKYKDIQWEKLSDDIR